MSTPGDRTARTAWERYGRELAAAALVSVGAGAGMLAFHAEPKPAALWFAFGAGGLLALVAFVSRLASRPPRSGG